VLGVRGTNFCAYSASGKMWTVFTCTICAGHERNEFCRALSMRGTNFIACWACAEPISSRAEHARKCFKSWISRPNQIRFSKISCYRPLGP
jgi:predicted amidophosphoribosyltransferase